MAHTEEERVFIGAGAVYKYDLSMPVGEMYSLVEDMRTRLEGLPVQARTAPRLMHHCPAACLGWS